MSSPCEYLRSETDEGKRYRPKRKAKTSVKRKCYNIKTKYDAIVDFEDGGSIEDVSLRHELHEGALDKWLKNADGIKAMYRNTLKGSLASISHSVYPSQQYIDIQPVVVDHIPTQRTERSTRDVSCMDITFAKRLEISAHVTEGSDTELMLEDYKSGK